MFLEANEPTGDDALTADSEPDARIKYPIPRIQTLGQLQQAFSDGLVELYKNIFSQAPYFESFTDEQVAKIFSEYLRNGILFIARDRSSVVGFGAAIPISTVKNIESLLSDNYIDPTTSWYMADLGIREDLRRNSLGKELVQKRIQSLPPGTTTVVMRTSIDNYKSQALYESLGFTALVDTHQNVGQTRIDGQTAYDRRIYLAKTL